MSNKAEVLVVGKLNWYFAVPFGLNSIKIYQDLGPLASSVGLMVLDVYLSDW